jgi:hypothetical protein
MKQHFEESSFTGYRCLEVVNMLLETQPRISPDSIELDAESM